MEQDESRQENRIPLVGFLAKTRICKAFKGAAINSCVIFALELHLALEVSSLSSLTNNGKCGITAMRSTSCGVILRHVERLRQDMMERMLCK